MVNFQFHHTTSSSDKADLIEVFVQAFLQDRVTRLKAARHDDRAAYIGSLIEKPLQSWLNRPERYFIVKVTERLRAVGWICWGLHGLSEATVQSLLEKVMPSSIDGGLSRTSRTTDFFSERLGGNPRGSPCTKSAAEDGYATTQGSSPEQSIEDLEVLCSADMQQWMARLMPENSAGMIVASICVEPKYQGWGIGRALLETGSHLADSEQLTTWVQSSESGQRLFASSGFEEIGRLHLDLREYGLDKGLRLSHPYIYRYMLRQPTKLRQ